MLAEIILEAPKCHFFRTEVYLYSQYYREYTNDGKGNAFISNLCNLFPTLSIIYRNNLLLIYDLFHVQYLC
jgi:hypothetical protein